VKTLPEPELERDGQTVRSKTFGDIYYSPEDGLAESRYVFIDGNDLPHRFAEERRGRPFVIGELGFGTGLNLLAAWVEWEMSGASTPLHFWSCEGFPLSHEDFRLEMERIGEVWPELTPHAERLASVYPVPMPGAVQRNLTDGVTLTLAFGTVLSTLRAATFRADAWFLDGFAPSANPDMWSSEVMQAIACRSVAGATAATFTVAGAVRENLAGAGFSWEKAPGFGRKKHMLKANLTEEPQQASERPWFIEPSPCSKGVVAIVGGGIAAAHMAHALTEAEWPVQIFASGGLGAGASGNPAGLIMPRLDADDGPAALLYRDAFLHAVATYTAQTPDAFHGCGGELAMEPDKKEALRRVGFWPKGTFRETDIGLHVPMAGVLQPALAINQLTDGMHVRDERVTAVKRNADGWLLSTEAGESSTMFTAIVVCGGAEQDLVPSLPVKPSLGQIDVFAGPTPERVLTDGGYVAPLQGALVAGATYTPYSGGSIETRPDHSAANQETAQGLLNQDIKAGVTCRAALRATTPDRHPIAGTLFDEPAALEAYAGLATGKRLSYPSAPYQEGLFTLTGLGSRGLVTAPILAAHVAAQITGGVSPLSRNVGELVHPGRFLIRAIRRGKA